MTTCHLTTGIPGSGKSTFAKSLGVLHFSLDDYRAISGVSKDDWTNDHEQVAIRTMIEGAKAAVVAGMDCVIDNTHLVSRLPKMYQKELGALGVTWKVHDFTNVPIEECIARDATRENGVGEAVIRKMAKRLAASRKSGWSLTEDWLYDTDYVKPEIYDERLAGRDNPDVTDVYICDIDGTVAINDGHRGHYEYEKVADDTPNAPVIHVIEAVYEGGYGIIFVSGREDRCRGATGDWIRRHLDIGNNWELFMRKTGDHRPDYIIKREIFDSSIRFSRYRVNGVFDDRDQVVKMWREMGLTCFQVAPGAF